MQATHPNVSIVVVNWNSGSALKRCLESLDEAPPSVAWEVIVVDNASTDSSLSEARSAPSSVRWIINASNRGLAAANNQGLIASRGETVLLCNADIGFAADSVDQFLAALERHPTAAFVVPRVTLKDGSVQTTAGDLPTLLEAMLGREFQRRRASGEARGWCWDGWSHDEERRIGRAGDVCYAVRRAAAADIGLQDERFPLDWEGIDWSATAHARGWEIWFCPEVRITHAAGGSTGKAGAARWVFATHRGMYRYFGKRAHARFRWALWLLFMSRALLKIAVIELGTPVRRWSRSA